MFCDFKKNIIIFITFFVYTIKAQTVSTASDLQNAISNATAGSEIVLANGVWNNVFIDITKNGTASQPITIKAQNPGSVFMTGNSRVYMRGTYITVSGLVFQNPSNLIENGSTIEPVFELNQCDNCKVTNNKIDRYNGTEAQRTLKFKWVLIVDGKYNEISHNSFIGKYGVGSIINDNRSNATEDYLKIHHNYFADRVPVNNDINGLNDQDAIRIGTSSTSLSDSYSEVYDNYFYNWSGEVEIISNKSGKNKYYNNTFRDYQGTLTLRHGNNCEVFNNYFFANNNPFTGGVRIIGEGHKVYNNYIEGVNSFKPTGSSSNVTGGINVMNGVTNSALNQYYQVKNTQIVNNTLVNCDFAIRIGTSLGGTEEPENLIVANNIMYNTSINAYQINTSPSGASVVEGNITQNGTWDLSNTNSNQTVSNGLLESGTEFYRIIDASPAIDASIGSYSFLNDDVLGGSRSGKADAGAEELNSNGTNLPYTNADVGEKIGFLSNISDHLTTSVTSVDFNIESGSKTFDIVSNIDWSISENSDWLSVNTTNGSNNATIEVTVTENTTGASRSATLTISENNGDLNRTVIVNQSLETFNVDDATALTDVTVTGAGTQEPNIPENTIDGDDTTRWSANSTNGSAYLTYNLGCKKTVTAVKIYFHKGNQRTSSFKIASSNDGTSFTDVTSVITSSGTTVGFEDFPFSPFQEVQYIRIYGYGNSEGSGWNSYEEVQIFGDDTCASLSLNNENLNKNHITFYPNPTNDFLNFSSNNNIGLVEIYDIKGKKIISKKINSNQGTIYLKSLVQGIYLIRLKDSFRKFIKD
ncbi:chondroitinase-B domain-containing protein [Polaribacter marinivivus]|uniref:chondroitinase-B domain-containing protein n=1 Tax=Polaribacter marinivivus TaxID=1524260 RepID=UPI003D339158